jgi:hypothetical protein
MKLTITILISVILLYPHIVKGRTVIDFCERSLVYRKYFPPIQRCLTAAFEMMLEKLSIKEKKEIRVLVDIGLQDIKAVGCQSEEFIPVEKTREGNIYTQGLAALLLDRGHPFNKHYHFRVLISANYLLKHLWFDPHPQSRTLPIPPGEKVDALSVFLHEIFHALAFNGWLDSKTGLSKSINNARSVYDKHVMAHEGQLFFNGPRAREVYGGPVPLNIRNYKHYGNKTGPGADLAGQLMFGEFYRFRYRFSVSLLDLAILEDCGLKIKER